MEKDHKAKYNQLKAMVDQYKSQMSEYVQITQQNYNILGDITSLKKQNGVEEELPKPPRVNALVFQHQSDEQKCDQ